MPTYKGKPVFMWSLIPQKKMPPTRTKRYCCSVLKETGCANRFIATGVRWDESKSRESRAEFEGITPKKENAIRVSDEVMLLNDNGEQRKLIEHCRQKSKSAVNPIVDWLDRDIWEYLHSEKIITNPLYGEGYWRVGCIGCPMAGKNRWKEFSDFPTYQSGYIRAFDKMLVAMRSDGTNRMPNWKNGEHVFRWWMEDKNIEGQMSIADYPGVAPNS